MDVALPQPVLGAVLLEALAGVDHEDAAAAHRVLLVDHHDARRDSGAVEEVGGEPDDSLDPAALDEIAPDGRFAVAAEEHAVRHDDRALAGTPERRDEVQQVGVISVLGRRLAVVEAAVFVVGRVEAVRPGLVGERGVGDGEVEALEAPRPIGELRGGECVVAPDLGCLAAVQDQVHPRHRPGRDVLFLPVDRQPVRRRVGGLDEERPGTARGIVHGLVQPGVRPDPDNLGHDAGHLRRGVELPLALPRLGGEVPHEVLVRVAQQVVAVGAVGAEIEPLEDPDELRETVLHLLPLAELSLVVEVREVDHALEKVVVGVGELADHLVDPVADLLGPLERDHVGEASPRRHRDVGELVVARVLVRDVLHEEQREHVVLVLGRVHSAAQLVAALPERGVEVGFAEGHGVGGGVRVWLGGPVNQDYRAVRVGSRTGWGGVGGEERFNRGRWRALVEPRCNVHFPLSYVWLTFVDARIC